MAELKPKMTSDYDSFRYSQSIPDQEPLYQRIGSPIMELKGKLKVDSKKS